MKSTRINASRIIGGSFFAAIIIGAVLLSLPFATTGPGSMPFIDALFTSTSAVCVTGLVVVDTGSYYTAFGQWVIMILFQIGGIGIMTLSTFFLVLLGKRLQMKDLFVINGTIGRESVHGVKGLLRYVLLVTFGFELLATVIISWRLIIHYDYGFFRAIHHALFHSISAFCNAGFSLYPDSLTRFRGDSVIVLIMGLLIVCGGLGFIVLLNIFSYRFWKQDITERGRIKFQTKLVITMSVMLLLVGMLAIFLLEWPHTLSGLPLKEKILASFFHGLTPRTAGFNTLSVANMGLATICFTLFLMFVGASPGSTGGGIKTSTFFILLANARSIISGSREVHLFSRTIPKLVIQEAICILAISMGFIFIFTMGLLISDGGWIDKSAFIKILFETMSAFSNVGLSTGITAGLSNIGKLIIILTMFIGRISPLTMALLVGRREEVLAVGYPTGTVMVG